MRGRHHLGLPVLAALCLGSLFATGAQAAGPAEPPYLNLDFETVLPHGPAKVWYQGGQGYEVTVNREVVRSGEHSLRIRHTGEEPGFGVATGTFPAAAATGRRIVYRGWIRTEGVESGHAGLWWRADGAGRSALAFDNMQDRGPRGTTEWTRYEIALDVPTETTGINFGVLLTGRGTAWFDGLEVLVDGEWGVGEVSGAALFMRRWTIGLRRVILSTSWV